MKIGKCVLIYETTYSNHSVAPVTATLHCSTPIMKYNLDTRDAQGHLREYVRAW